MPLGLLFKNERVMGTVCFIGIFCFIAQDSVRKDTQERHFFEPAVILPARMRQCRATGNTLFSDVVFGSYP